MIGPRPHRHEESTLRSSFGVYKMPNTLRESRRGDARRHRSGSTRLTLVTVASVRSLWRRPLGIGRLLATSVATGAGWAAEAHLRPIASRGLSRRTAVVTLLPVLSCYKTVSDMLKLDGDGNHNITHHRTGGSIGKGFQGSLVPEHSGGCTPGWDRMPVGWESCPCPTGGRLVSMQ